MISKIRGNLRRALAEVLKGSDGTLVIGPAVWDIAPSSDQRHRYFVLGTGKRRGTYFFTLQVKLASATSDEDAEAERARFLLALTARRPPLVLHVFDDELALAELAPALWPCVKSRAILRDLRRERGVPPA